MQIRLVCQNRIELISNFHSTQFDSGKPVESARRLISTVASVNATFSKNGALSNDLKGVVMKNFPKGKPPDPCFSSLRLHLGFRKPPPPTCTQVKSFNRAQGNQMNLNYPNDRGPMYLRKLQYPLTSMKKLIFIQIILKYAFTIFLFFRK